MKQLRILTGVHAGAQLDLPPGRYRIATDAEADIQLTDWPGVDARLEVDKSGRVGLVQPADAADDAAQRIWLLPHVPMPFEGVALCLGDSDVRWPDDIELLGTLYVKPLSDAGARRRRAVGVALACAMVGSLIVAGGALVLPGPTRAASAPDPRALQVVLQRALADAHLEGLDVVANEAGLRVNGMVPTAADDMRVRELLGRLRLGRVERAYDVAQTDAHGIEDALGLDGARVRYVGNGEFEVAGTVRGSTQLQAAITRVRADLDANVRALRPAADVAFADNLPDSFSEVISVDDLTYGQTPDGVKHLYTQPQTD